MPARGAPTGRQIAGFRSAIVSDASGGSIQGRRTARPSRVIGRRVGGSYGASSRSAGEAGPGPSRHRPGQSRPFVPRPVSGRGRLRRSRSGEGCRPAGRLRPRWLRAPWKTLPSGRFRRCRRRSERLHRIELAGKPVGPPRIFQDLERAVLRVTGSVNPMHPGLTRLKHFWRARRSPGLRQGHLVSVLHDCQAGRPPTGYCPLPTGRLTQAG
jgi:hypothetical protein